jgi:hypothetical protein
MPREFRRPEHQAVASVLRKLDAALLAEAGCFFGGGTFVALHLDEFRVSRDIDFLVSRRDGFRRLRETVTESSLGKIARGPIALAREVRADRDGIRTFIVAGEVRIKLELILEARIDLSGDLDAGLGVPVLDLDCLFAEKLLANADRGLDSSTYSRDAIDLAFLTARHGGERLERGLALAESAYGQAVVRSLRAVLDQLSGRGRLASCAEALGLSDLATARKGIKALRALLRTR